MPCSHPKVNLLTGGWYIQYKNKDVLTEGEVSWTLVPNKKDIILMGLKRHNKLYELENKTFGPPGETHVRELAIASGGLQVTKQSLVGWYLTYYTQTHKVFFRVEASTGKVWEDAIPFNNPDPRNPLP